MCDGEFLVPLSSFSSCLRFKIYLDDNLVWETGSPLFYLILKL